MNKFQVIGRYTSDPELRYTKDNKPVANFNIAINNGKDKNGNEDTTFIKISVFGATAENIGKYSKKGDLILVEGIIKNNNYEAKDGNKHYEYIFIGNRVEFLSRTTNNTPKEKQAKKEPKNSELDDKVFEDFGNSIEISDSELAF
jgi:single-strand DNA-binding protein